MRTKDTQKGKTVGFDTKPARIVIETTDGEKAYDAEHHIRSDNGWVSIYLGAKQDGIDVQVPRERVVEILRGREHHDQQTEEDKKLVADGGQTCGCGAPIENDGKCYACAGRRSMEIVENANVEPGDRVEYDGQTWTFEGIECWHLVNLTADDGGGKHGVDIRELTLVESHTNIESGDEVKYRHTLYDKHTGETDTRYATYTVGRHRDGTVTLNALVSDGEGSVTTERVTELDVSELGRCVECGSVMAYSDDECHECADAGDAE